MVPYPPHHRRESPQVYRVRRAIALTVLVVMVFGVLRLAGVGGAGGGGDEAGTTTSSTTTTTIPAAPACQTGEVLTQDDPATGWQTIVVDTERALPDGYAPDDLVNISEAGFPFTDGLALRSLVVADLNAMREAAAANGTPLSILAAYRSHAQQASLYERRVDDLGASEAGGRVARPGHSEHQLGTTIDVTSEGMDDVDQAWGASPTGQWVASNAHKYGFLVSYPSGASGSTCFDYEPWHLRYVGREMAAEVVASGLTLRHYLYVNHPPTGWDPTAPPATTSSTVAEVTEG
ncbi:MAG: M15 family metallopeptidase [Acidimicrobiia bacterium]